MGVSARVFLIHDDDSIHRIPLSRFLRLHDRDKKECFPEHARKRVRYAFAAIDLVDRKPVEFLYMEYGHLNFDANGQLDVVQQEKADRFGAENDRLKRRRFVISEDSACPAPFFSKKIFG